MADTSSGDKLVEVEELSRRYGDLEAVRSISFELRAGEVLGFLGPNGAGKSSTMEMICGTLAPSGGAIRINGVDLLESPEAAKAQIGFLPEQPPLYPELTVDEYLTYVARLHKMPRAEIPAALSRARQRCGLAGAGGRLIGNLSKGYQQRVGIAQAIIHSPRLVVLDEPTIGLDPIQIREIRQLIRELGRDHGVILSTHILPEVQMACSRVQIIHRGRLVYSDHIDNLSERLAATSLVLGLRRPPADGEIQAVAGVERVEPIDEGRRRVHFAAGASPAEALAERAVQNGWGLVELTPEAHTLEQIFIELTSTDPTTDPKSEEAAA